LPVPVRDGAAFGIGHFIHVVGGLDAGGEPVPTIWYAYADPVSGLLGFGGADIWARHSRPLPEGRAGAAWAIHDGRLFLAGGRGPEGLVADILHAGLYKDGYPGFWYRSPEALPRSVSGAAAAVLADPGSKTARLCIAGGRGTDSLPSEGVSFRIGLWGILSDPESFTLPASLFRPLLIPGRDTLILADGAGTEVDPMFFLLYDDGAWAGGDGIPTRSSVTDSPAGPASSSYAVAAGRLLTFGPDAVLRSIDAALAPEAPQVLPGSGIVPAGTYVRVRPEPGTTLRYRTSIEGPVDDVETDDPVWQPGYQLLSSADLAFRAFDADDRASALVRRSYEVRTQGMFLHTVLLPVRSPEDEELRPLPPGWYFFNLSEASSLVLAWQDAREVPDPGMELPDEAEGDGDGVTEGPALLSVFEPDLCTPVPDAAGVLSLYRLDLSASPVRLSLPSGTFYLQIQAPASDPTHPGILATLVRDGG
jgi:hypothetical protein